MGYTHYYNIKPGGPQQQWTAAVLKLKDIIDASLVPLGDAFGEGEVSYSDEAIRLNGIGEDAHETFTVPTVLAEVKPPPYAASSEDRAEVFHFTKTARKPYDIVVVACLATLSHFAPDVINVTSDGEEEQWLAGVELASKVIGEPIPVPPEVRE